MSFDRVFTEQEAGFLRTALAQNSDTQSLWNAIRDIEPLQCTPNGSKNCKELASLIFEFYMLEEKTSEKRLLVLELMSEMLERGF
jgi:hypothetical protein